MELIREEEEGGGGGGAHLKNVTKNCTRSMKLLCCEKAICNKRERKGQKAASEICFNREI